MSEWGRLQDSLHDHFDKQGVTGVDVDKLIEHIVNIRDFFPGVLADRPPVSGEPRTERWTVRNSQGKEVEMSIHDHDGGEHCFSSCPAWRGASTGAELDVLRDLDVAFQWIADNYPAALTAMPTPIYRGLTRARTHAARLAEQEGDR